MCQLLHGSGAGYISLSEEQKAPQEEKVLSIVSSRSTLRMIPIYEDEANDSGLTWRTSFVFIIGSARSGLPNDSCFRSPTLSRFSEGNTFQGPRRVPGFESGSQKVVRWP